MCTGYQRCPSGTPNRSAASAETVPIGVPQGTHSRTGPRSTGSIRGSCCHHLGGPGRGVDVKEAGAGGQSPVDRRAATGGNEVAQSTVGPGGRGTPGSVPCRNLVDREHPVERLTGDLLHPFGTESLAHRPGRQLAACVHADRCQAERLALAVDRDDDFSLAAQAIARTSSPWPAALPATAATADSADRSTTSASRTTQPSLGRLRLVFSAAAAICCPGRRMRPRTPLVPRSIPTVLTRWSRRARGGAE